MSTHPDPGNRIGELQKEIAAEFPAGRAGRPEAINDHGLARILRISRIL